MPDPNDAPASAPVTFSKMSFWQNPNVHSWLVGLFMALFTAGALYVKTTPFPAGTVPVAVQPAPAPVALTPAELQAIIEMRKAQGGK